MLLARASQVTSSRFLQRQSSVVLPLAHIVFYTYRQMMSDEASFIY